MSKKLIISFIYLFITYSFSATAEDTNITFNDLLTASLQINNSKPHKRVDKTIAGQEIEIHGKKYEIRFFSFEDPKNILAKNISFSYYIVNNNLGKTKARHMKYMPSIEFEVFDYRFTKLEDGIYFSMALRQI